MPTSEVYMLQAEAYDLLREHSRQYPELTMYLDSLESTGMNLHREGKKSSRLTYILLSQWVFDNYETPNPNTSVVFWPLIGNRLERPSWRGYYRFNSKQNTPTGGPFK